MSSVWFLICLSIVFIWLTGLSVLFLRKPQIKSDSLNTNLGLSGLNHWSLIRFNPFPDTGGSHSFVVCLLDNLKNGILLTSLHSRGITRFYAKRVDGGRSDQDLSGEEQQALNQAIKS